MIISAPTSSGKTVLLELAIVRLMITYDQNVNNYKNFKIIYMAPLKALCSEKFTEWNDKFGRLHNLKCIELTGDTEHDSDKDFGCVADANIICTTPEKWDVMTRKWKNQQEIMRCVKLFLIDEIHIIGESSRGATIEAVVSRMKALDSLQQQQQQTRNNDSSQMRFIAISATIPNINDFSCWLGTESPSQFIPAIAYKLNENYRPVVLEKVVIGYPCSTSNFIFDMSLCYKLSDIIDKYSNMKPTLIFCATRKGTQQAAEILAKTSCYIRSVEHRNKLIEIGSKLKDSKLRELVTSKCIGYHHAGLDTADRHLIENLFLKGYLLVLMSTSTLAIGVNLPAHLVIIKSTMFYSTDHSFIDYSTSQILQMIGRAGRPQFDKTATSVIMTKIGDKMKYETLLEGSQLIESHFHHNLIEHLNVEIVLKTIVNLATAIQWLKSTFFYARICKNPAYYGIKILNNSRVDETSIDSYLVDLLIKNLTSLMSVKLIEKFDLTLKTNEIELKSTRNGILMARYCLAFETMKSIITQLDSPTNNNEDNFKTIEDLIILISDSKEFEDVKLRTNEKSILNALNNNGKIPKSKGAQELLDTNPNMIRYKFGGKMKTSRDKVNTLIQAQLGSININDFSLTQDIFRIFRVGIRISRCLLEFLSQNLSSKHNKIYQTFLNAVILNKCFTTKMWHDSVHVFKQFNRIGATLSQTIIAAGIKSFDEMSTLDATQIEAILNKNPPFGNGILETIQKLPRFHIEFEVNPNKFDSNHFKSINVNCIMDNYDLLKMSEERENTKKEITSNYPFYMMFIIGDERDHLLFSSRIKLVLF
jgi:ATP-dependent DNA helicase HFM1/MER3